MKSTMCGFNGEKVKISVRRDLGENHDHLYIEVDGKEVGYFHISRGGYFYLHFFSDLAEGEVSVKRLQ